MPGSWTKRATIQRRLQGDNLLEDDAFIASVIHETTPDDPELQHLRTKHAEQLRAKARACANATATQSDADQQLADAAATIASQQMTIEKLVALQSEHQTASEHVSALAHQAGEITTLFTAAVTELELRLQRNEKHCAQLHRRKAEPGLIAAAEADLARTRELLDEACRIKALGQRYQDRCLDTADLVEDSHEAVLQALADHDVPEPDEPKYVPSTPSTELVKAGSNEQEVIASADRSLAVIASRELAIRRRFSAPEPLEIVEAELLPPPSPVDEAPGEAMDAQAVEDIPPTDQASAHGTVIPAPTSSPAVPNPNGSTGFWWFVAGTAAYLTYKAVKGCTTCQNTRTIACFKCRGTGKVATTATCPACNGNRTRDGYTLCPVCRGASTVSVDADCQNCDSSGRRRCPSCY